MPSPKPTEIPAALHGRERLALTEVSDAVIKKWRPPPELNYTFSNPGFAIVAQRPYPESPRTIDTSGEVWKYDNGRRAMRWPDIKVPTPLKEAMKGYVHNLLQTRAIGTAEMAFAALLRLQPLLRNPADYPLTQDKAVWILGCLHHDRSTFFVFQELYRWSVGEVPGFTQEILDAVESIKHAVTPHYVSVKHRAHVLTDLEDYALRRRLASTEPSIGPEYPLLPSDLDPEAEYSLADLAEWHQHKDYYVRLPWSFRGLMANRYGLEPTSRGRQGEPVSKLRYLGRDILAKITPYLRQQQFMWLRNNLLTHLTYTHGPRPTMTAGINEKGFIVEPAGEGDEPIYKLKIPRAKQRTSKPTFKVRVLSPDLGQKFVAYLQLKHEIYGQAKGDRPMFIRQEIGGVARITSDNITMIVREFLKGAGLAGWNPRGLRHNLAQKLADMGIPGIVISEILDHEDSGSISAYVRAALTLSEVQDQALQSHPRYQEVMGKLAGKIPVVVNGMSKGANVVSGTVARVFIGGIGVCGQADLPCSKSPVYSCCGCDKFHPFADLKKFRALQEALRGEIQDYLHNAADKGLTHKLALSHADILMEIEVVVHAIIDKLAQEGSNEGRT